MFDIGFLELVIIGIVGLVVIGPERLPGVARSVGKWVGRTRRFISNVKSDIDRELRDEELRQALDRDANLDEIKNIINDTRYKIEDEVAEMKDFVVKARDDDPGRDSQGEVDQDALLKEQENDFGKEYDDVSSDHVDLGADEYDEPVKYGNKIDVEDKEIKQAAKDDGQNNKSNG